MKALTVQLDDEAAEIYAQEARALGVTLEQIVSAVAASHVTRRAPPMSAEQIARVEAGLAAEREGRVLSAEAARARLAERRGR